MSPAISQLSNVHIPLPDPILSLPFCLFVMSFCELYLLPSPSELSPPFISHPTGYYHISIPEAARMNTYSKMRAFGTHKSRSVDFSELLPSFPAEHPKPIAKAGIEESRPDDSCCSEKDKDDYSDGERFGVILGRSSSVSAASDGQKDAGIVKRVFSMRRSSSVSERYCRIHDQSVTLSSSQVGEEEGSVEGMGSAKKKKKKKNRIVNIFKAGKRLLGI